MDVTLEFSIEAVTVMTRLLHDLPPLPLEVEMSRRSGLQRPMVAGGANDTTGEMTLAGAWMARSTLTGE
jgi:hypothetical protein